MARRAASNLSSSSPLPSLGMLPRLPLLLGGAAAGTNCCADSWKFDDAVRGEVGSAGVGGAPAGCDALDSRGEAGLNFAMHDLLWGSPLGLLASAAMPVSSCNLSSSPIDVYIGTSPELREIRKPSSLAASMRPRSSLSASMCSRSALLRAASAVSLTCASGVGTGPMDGLGVAPLDDGVSAASASAGDTHTSSGCFASEPAVRDPASVCDSLGCRLTTLPWRRKVTRPHEFLRSSGLAF